MLGRLLTTSAAVFMAVMAFSGCDRTSASPALSSAAAYVAPSISIDAEGDSTMYTICELPNKSYVQCNPTVPQMLQAALQATFGSTVTVTNNGYPGSTVSSRLKGKFYRMTFAQELPSMRAQFIICNWLDNDATPGAGETVSEYKADLIDVINIARTDGVTPILEEPSPTSFPAAQLAYVRALRDVAAEMHVPLIAQFDYLQSLPNWRSMLQPDGIHPGLQMYRIKAQREADVMIPLVRRALAQ